MFAIRIGNQEVGYRPILAAAILITLGLTMGLFAGSVSSSSHNNVTISVCAGKSFRLAETAGDCRKNETFLQWSAGSLDPNLGSNVVTDSANITVTSGGDGNDQNSAGIGLGAVIQLTGLGSTPIAGTLADVQANTVISVDGGTTNLVGTEIGITNFHSGTGEGPWISVVVNTAGPYTINYIEYPVEP